MTPNGTQTLPAVPHACRRNQLGPDHGRCPGCRETDCRSDKGRQIDAKAKREKYRRLVRDYRELYGRLHAAKQGPQAEALRQHMLRTQAAYEASQETLARQATKYALDHGTSYEQAAEAVGLDLTFPVVV